MRQRINDFYFILKFFHYEKFQACIKEKENRITKLHLPIHSFNSYQHVAILVLSVSLTTIFPPPL